MAKKIKILNTGEVKWPNCCAYCRIDKGLQSAGASVGRVASVRPTMTGAIAVSTEIMSLNYPVCASHAKGLVFANTITRNTLGLSLLRGLIYFIGIPALITLPLMLIGFLLTAFSGAENTSTDFPMVFMFMYVIAAILLIKLMSAYGKLPLRITKMDEDSITVRFKNNVYATQFMRLNKDILVESQS